MLDAKEFNIINKILAKGYDVEIQHRKNGLVIIKSNKDICYRQENEKPKDDKSAT